MIDKNKNVIIVEAYSCSEEPKFIYAHNVQEKSVEIEFVRNVLPKI